MKKVIISLALLLTAAVSTNAQLLYKISGNGLSKNSYIIGTYHLATSSFTDSIPGLKAALDETEQVYGEVVMDDMTSPENALKTQQAMMLEDGKTLTSLLNEEQQGKLNAVLTKTFGVDLTNPMMKQQLDAFTPQALMTQLSLMSYLKREPSFNPLDPFDGYFQNEAKKNGKDVKGFETLDFQLDALFGGITLERQVELLMCYCDNYEYMESQTERTIKAFYSQDIKSIEEITDERLNNSCDNTDEENERILYGRNDNWLSQMPDIMKQKPTFFAVGAAHLVGERGVLNGLRKVGYTVTGVK